MESRYGRKPISNRQFAAYSWEADKSKTEAAVAVDTNPSSIGSSASEKSTTDVKADASSIGSSDSRELPTAGAEVLPVPPGSSRAKRETNIPARFRTDAWAESLRNYKQNSKTSTPSVKSAASSSSSSSQETRLPKITVGYATNDALYKDIIGMLLAGMSISSITTVLCNANNKYREILTQNARPDQECTIAKEAGAEGLKDYKNAPERNKGTHAYDVDPAILDVPAVNGLKRPFYLALVLDKTKGKKRMTSVPFTPTHMGDCGTCWLCNLQVHYYWQKDKGYINTTGCGDCEHVGAIVAAFLAGMLSNQGNPDQFKTNYHPSHPHCNKWKSNTIPMKFDKTSGKWVHDTKGIATIAKDIANHPIHGSEYCPKFINAYNEKKITVESVKTCIKGPTDKWCTAANDLLTKYTNEKKANIASALASIIAKTAPKLISTTTVNSVKKVKMQRKQSGGCGAGEHILVEEIPREDAVNIYDTNTFYELQPTDDDDELKSLQTEYYAIFDESAGEEAVDIAFECLFNVFDAIEDPYKIGSGVSGILNVLSRYLYGLDQDAVKNQELINDISSRIRTITDKFGDELNNTDYEVLDINHDAPANFIPITPQKEDKKRGSAYSTRTGDASPSKRNRTSITFGNLNITGDSFQSKSEDTDHVNITGDSFQSKSEVTDHVNISGDSSQSESEDTDHVNENADAMGSNANNANIVGQDDPELAEIDDKRNNAKENKYFGHNNESRSGSAASVPIEYYNARGGSRLNKSQSKQKSQKRNQKNKTKRISYIKHKQTRKNKHSKKTKSKRSNKK